MSSMRIATMLGAAAALGVASAATAWDQACSEMRGRDLRLEANNDKKSSRFIKNLELS